MITLNPLSIENTSCFRAAPPRHALLAGVLKLVHAIRLHLNTVSGLRRRGVVSVLDNARVEEVFVQMVDILQHTQLATDNHVVDGAQVLCVFRKTHAARVGHNGDVEFLGHEQHGEDLVDAAHAAGVDLTDVDRALLEELLEDDAILAHLARGDADSVWFQGFADGLVAEDVVRRGGLFDEPGLKFRELLHVFNCFRDGPDLCGHFVSGTVGHDR